MDLKGFGLRNADMQLAQLFVDAFFNYYPRRLGLLLMVDAPMIFQPTWQIIKPLLRSYSRLVKFVKRSEVADYFEPGRTPEEFL
mmetsp:Transcript_5357/g.12891  ORF Transcript_5357/g.12891 Transcript_5357/m.12891 type:complete len:84 (-) Transcript_5357:682-933(-)